MRGLKGICSLRLMMSTLLASAALVAAHGAAHAAPSQLYGKSVVVTWTEEREQRNEANPDARFVSRNGSFSVYLSSTGRPFSRLSYSFVGGGRKGGLRSGARDAVGGEGGGNVSVSISGNGLTAVRQMQGGARHIAVTFDSGFAGCSAQVLTGKESGAASMHGRSMINGAPLEIISVKTSAASCRIQDGNVFGN